MNVAASVKGTMGDGHAVFRRAAAKPFKSSEQAPKQDGMTSNAVYIPANSRKSCVFFHRPLCRSFTAFSSQVGERADWG